MKLYKVYNSFVGAGPWHCLAVATDFVTAKGLAAEKFAQSSQAVGTPSFADPYRFSIEIIFEDLSVARSSSPMDE